MTVYDDARSPDAIATTTDRVDSISTWRRRDGPWLVELDMSEAWMRLRRGSFLLSQAQTMASWDVNGLAAHCKSALRNNWIQALPGMRLAPTCGS